MFCSKCGGENTDGARFCVKCGSGLAVVAASEPSAPPATMRTLVAAAPQANGALYEPATGKTPWLAVVLSFFVTGVGQFYNNDWKKGAVMFGVALLGIVFTGGLLAIPIWIWSMIDAYRVARGAGTAW